MKAYRQHLTQAKDLVTTETDTRAGFLKLALEKNRRLTPYVEEARVLQKTISDVQEPTDLRKIPGIQSALLTAAGLSNKAMVYLRNEDQQKAIDELFKNFLEPAGSEFKEELIYRFLLIRGDSFGGSMRNLGGFLAQMHLTSTLVAVLHLAGIRYSWKNGQSNSWHDEPAQETHLQARLRGLSWTWKATPYTLLYNYRVPVVGTSVDLCVLSQSWEHLEPDKPESYVALGELKGGIDPAGADEHWETARTALLRIRDAFSKHNSHPALFFIGAAIEPRMADEIWAMLEADTLSNAANLLSDKQVVSLARWLLQFDA